MRYIAQTQRSLTLDALVREYQTTKSIDFYDEIAGAFHGIITGYILRHRRWASFLGWSDMYQECAVGLTMALHRWDGQSSAFLTYGFIYMRSRVGEAVIRKMEFKRRWVGWRAPARILTNRNLGKKIKREDPAFARTEDRDEAAVIIGQVLLDLGYRPQQRNLSIVYLRIVKEWTLEKIGKRFHVSRERVRAIVKKELARMRTSARRFCSRQEMEGSAYCGR